ncbi:MAG: histone deacetylase [Pirellulales bacterium]|nr:histone deacetylase [Pirellulales bacterium]
MTWIYSHSDFLAHQTGTHPERPERLIAILRQLERTGLGARCHHPTWEVATTAELTTIHGTDYLNDLNAFCLRGGGRIEEDTVVSARSYDIARLAAGAAISATRAVISGDTPTALCLVRPPGHHARRDTAMGFCLINNISVAAHAALAAGLSRILIIDWDVHHGNGTQEQFYTDPRVGFFSIHRWPFYPGTGDHDETGSGPGLGTTKNLPIAWGTSRQEYLNQFTEAVEGFADKIRPELVLLSAGFDAHRDDPVGSLGLETEDFAMLTQIVGEITATWCGKKLVSVLEGGYNTGVLAGCVEEHVRGLLTLENRDIKSA